MCSCLRQDTCFSRTEIMESGSETEESEATSRTFDKMKSSVHKLGFVEGLTSGKEAAFQNGFDDGYKEGFCNGFKLGKLNGILRVLQDSGKDEKYISDVVRNVQMEPNTKQGMCLLCNPQKMESYSGSGDNSCNLLDDNIKLQKESVQLSVSAHLTKLRDVYALYNISEI